MNTFFLVVAVLLLLFHAGHYHMTNRLTKEESFANSPPPTELQADPPRLRPSDNPLSVNVKFLHWLIF